MTESNPVATKSQVVAWCQHIVNVVPYYCVIVLVSSYCHLVIVLLCHLIIALLDYLVIVS